MKITELKDNSRTQAVRWRVIVTIGLVCAAVAFSVWYLSPAGEQRRNLAAAERHIAAVLQPRLVTDGRFPNVALTSYTGEGGAIAVTGEVATWGEAAELRALVIGTHPRCAVDWGGLSVKESLEREAPDASLLERVTWPEKKK